MRDDKGLLHLHRVYHGERFDFRSALEGVEGLEKCGEDVVPPGRRWTALSEPLGSLLSK